MAIRHYSALKEAQELWGRASDGLNASFRHFEGSLDHRYKTPEPEPEPDPPRFAQSRNRSRSRIAILLGAGAIAGAEILTRSRSRSRSRLKISEMFTAPHPCRVN